MSWYSACYSWKNNRCYQNQIRIPRIIHIDQTLRPLTSSWIPEKKFLCLPWARTWFFFCTSKSTVLKPCNVLRPTLYGNAGGQRNWRRRENIVLSREIVDAYCGNENAVVTRTPTTHIELVRHLYWKDELIRCRKVQLRELQVRAGNFKAEGRNKFLSYQPSALGTRKWHTVHYFPDTLKRLEDIRFAHAVLFEAAHEKSKQNYRRWSPRWRSVVDEVVAREKYFVAY